MFDIQIGDQGPHPRPNLGISFDGQRRTIAVSAATDLDHLLVLGGQGSDGGDIDFLGNQANGSFCPFQRCTTGRTVGFLDHDDGIWMRIAFSVMPRMSLLAPWFLATLFPLTSRSWDQVL